MGLKAAILGTTGYTGMVLLRLLEAHPDITEILPGSSSKAGEPIQSADPGFAFSGKCAGTGNTFLAARDILSRSPDVVFSCLPHLASIKMCEPFIGKSVVIDLSADLRIPDSGIFFEAYKENPPVPELLGKAVFGLAEIYEEQIRTADIIAVPGCYPTATLLPLLPVLKEFGQGGKIIVNAMSGISGAGKKARENLILSERAENACAYLPGKSHRHFQEINYYIARYCGDRVKYDLLFTPHLVPMKRGMEVTTVIDIPAGTGDKDIKSAYEAAYSGSPFVRIREAGPPETRETRGSNSCLINWHIDGTSLLIFSAIDNLVKGASGQAVQNMNIRFGLKEEAGLTLFGEV